MGVSTCNRYEELVDELRKSPRIESLNNEFRVNFNKINIFFSHLSY
jgi:hypothetical protein